ncbi:PAS and ANTAR domain-containing protein [Promicromonospora sukumoe]|uniref:PAS and ANTAR domain-containing protein n=1 Tax=Promicromonospora sukumoe TaxID=88382 RepID=UPI003646AD00
MNDTQPSSNSVEAALAPGQEAPVGRYRLELSTGRWAWSDEVFLMHGFQPGEVVPTTELVLAHKHPEDRERVDHVMRKANATGRPFSSVHRIQDAHGTTRTLTVTGQATRDPKTGEVTEIRGYFIDVTEASREDAAQQASTFIQASSASRATIEQAKGVLMVAFGIDDDAAFDRLRTASNDLNIPVRDLAGWLMSWFTHPSNTDIPTADEVADFLTAPVPSAGD